MDRYRDCAPGVMAIRNVSEEIEYRVVALATSKITRGEHGPGGGVADGRGQPKNEKWAVRDSNP